MLLLQLDIHHCSEHRQLQADNFSEARLVKKKSPEPEGSKYAPSLEVMSMQAPVSLPGDRTRGLEIACNRNYQQELTHLHQRCLSNLASDEWIAAAARQETLWPGCTGWTRHCQSSTHCTLPWLHFGGRPPACQSAVMQASPG